MPNKVISISDYSAKADDLFFFDNNIWMYLYCTIQNYDKDKQTQYSSFFTSLLTRKLHIYVNSLILSEFANAFMRLDFSKFKEEESKSGNYKEIFVGTERYKKTSALVKINMAKIVAVCQKCSDEFTSINLEPIFENFGQMDLNDSYYLELASKKKWIIVTDDADLVKADIPGKNLTILTYGKASKRF